MLSPACKVSTIIPTYNYGRFLIKAIDSVLHQTYPHHEIIVVDDASTDDTRQIVQNYSDPRIRYTCHDVNRGPSAARNTGIRLARGAFVAFLDSDDEWLPEKLQLQLDLFRNGPDDLGLVYCSAKHVNESNETLAVVQARVRNRALMDVQNIGLPSTVMIKRQCFDRVGLFDETILCHEDWDMWLRISQLYLVDYVDQILVIHRTHGSNISADMLRTIRGREYLLQKHRQWYTQYPDVHALNYYLLGIQCYKQGFMKKGRGHFLNAMKYSKAKSLGFKFKCLLQYLMSFVGQPLYLKLRGRFIDR